MGNQEQWQQDERRWSSLMALAHEGDSCAYEQLLIELAEVIEKYLLVRLGRFNTLEDMVQECLLAVHSGRHTYSPQRPFRPWMFTVVRNKSIDLLRRQQLDRRHQDFTLAAEISAGCSEEDHAISIDLERILDGLSPDYREALTLTKYAGMTVNEAAAWTGTSKAAMKIRVFRALSETRKRMAREDLKL